MNQLKKLSLLILVLGIFFVIPQSTDAAQVTLKSKTAILKENKKFIKLGTGETELFQKYLATAKEVSVVSTPMKELLQVIQYNLLETDITEIENKDSELSEKYRDAERNNPSQTGAIEKEIQQARDRKLSLRTLRMRIYSQMISLDFNDRTTHYNFGNDIFNYYITYSTYAEPRKITMFDRKKALMYLTKAYSLTTRQQDKIDVSNVLGEAYWKSGDEEIAEYRYKNTLKIDPKNTEALNSLGRLKGSESIEGLKYLEQAYEINKKDYDTLLNLGRGYAYSDVANHYELAEKYYLEVFNLGDIEDSEKVFVVTRLMIMYGNWGKFNKCIEYGQPALDSFPESYSDLYGQLIWCYVKNNQRDKALKVVEQGTEYFKKFPESKADKLDVINNYKTGK